VVRALDPARRVAILDDGTELPYDLFLGVPKHRVPDVVAASGLAEDGWIPVDRATLKTRFPGVYAVGDVTSVGTPRAGVFSEGAARVVAAALIAEVQGSDQPAAYTGQGSLLRRVWGRPRRTRGCGLPLGADAHGELHGPLCRPGC
jgi:sulfide:quinone oxidoreductase